MKRSDNTLISTLNKTMRALIKILVLFYTLSFSGQNIMI